MVSDARPTPCCRIAPGGILHAPAAQREQSRASYNPVGPDTDPHLCRRPDAQEFETELQKEKNAAGGDAAKAETKTEEKK